MNNKKLLGDTLKTFQIDTYTVTPLLNFKFSTLFNSSNYTLVIASCSEYLLFPFGNIESKADLKKSLLKNFNIVDRRVTMEIGPEVFQILKLNSNRLILYFINDDSERSPNPGSYIFKGEIFDEDAHFINNIKVGMNKEEFFKKFFAEFPLKLQDKFNVIVFEYCVSEITHIYNFNNSKLESVKFISDSYWKVDY